jgi:biotin carboxylase
MEEAASRKNRDDVRPTLLCLASYEKGGDFLRECRALGARVLLLTVESLRAADWPRDAIDELYVMPDLYDRKAVFNAVAYLARSERIARIVPLDEFDLEIAAALREHLRIPGMGETTMRYFRDKLAMRLRAEEAGIRVPDFVPLVHPADVARFLAVVPPPWILKPRMQASTIGIRKLGTAEDVWRALDTLGDEQASHVLERFVPGDVYHVDAIVADRSIVFMETHRYARPPLDVYHGGGMFSSRTLERGGDEDRVLRARTERVVAELGLVRGVVHTEFIRGHEDGEFHFLETAARVGGAHIVEMIEAATGVNLWREWARLELADARGEPYASPSPRDMYAGVVISLARQEWPDTSAYTDPEIVWRLRRRHHVGLIVASAHAARVAELLDGYMRRIYDDFHAVLPPSESATA